MATDPTLPPRPSSNPTVTTKKKFWTRTRVAMAVVGAVGVTVSYFVFVGKLDVGDFFDDERPPIIVNNGGSVQFDIHLHWKGKGEWKVPVISTGNVYEHLHPNTQPTYFLVTAKKATCSDGGNGPYQSDKVDIVYGDGTTNETATLSVGANGLSASFPAPPSATTTQLSVHDGNAGVWIRSMTVGTVTCTFGDDNGSIKIKQKH